MVGAFRPRMLGLAARHADWWNASSTGIEGYRRMVEQLDQSCMEVGRDPTTLRRTWSGGCLSAPTQHRVTELANDRYTTAEDDFSFVGTPSRIVEQMAPFIATGVDYFIPRPGLWTESSTPGTLSTNRGSCAVARRPSRRLARRRRIRERMDLEGGSNSRYLWAGGVRA